MIVRRFDGSGDYNRSWAEYKSGFGDAGGEVWLGNEYLHYLTDNRYVYNSRVYWLFSCRIYEKLHVNVL